MELIFPGGLEGFHLAKTTEGEEFWKHEWGRFIARLKFLYGLDLQLSSSSRWATRQSQHRKLRPTDGPVELRLFIMHYLERRRIQTRDQAPILARDQLGNEYCEFMLGIEGHEFQTFLMTHHPGPIPVDQTEGHSDSVLGALVRFISCKEINVVSRDPPGQRHEVAELHALQSGSACSRDQTGAKPFCAPMVQIARIIPHLA